MTTQKTIRLAFDMKQNRPGCAIVQGLFGCPGTSPVLCKFDPGTWLTSPTDDMVVIAGTVEQWAGKALQVNREAAKS